MTIQNQELNQPTELTSASTDADQSEGDYRYENPERIESLIPTINLTEFDLSYDLARRYNRSARNLRSRATTWKRKTRNAMANAKPEALKKWQDDLDARFHRADVAEATAEAISRELYRIAKQKQVDQLNSESQAVVEVAKKVGFRRLVEIVGDLKNELAIQSAMHAIQRGLGDINDVDLTIENFQEAVNRLRDGERPESTTDFFRTWFDRSKV
jgi:hypothetical protein